MLAVTFNAGYAGYGYQRTVKELHRGRWFFKRDMQSHRNDVIIVEEHGDKEETTFRFQYDARSRKWTPAVGSPTVFWAPGLRGQKEPLRRFERTQD